LLAFQKQHKTVSESFPSVSQIAQIAATMAHGRDIANPPNLKFISTQAIALWEECEKARDKRIQMLAIYARAEAIKAQRDKLPKPKTFPASFEESLKFLMPKKKRPEDRMKCYRDYLLNTIERRNVVTGTMSELSTDQEISQWIESNKKDGFKYEEFDYFSEQFQKWLPKYEAENRRRRATAGAAALKKKRQKNG
jgi:hypothetical protein